MKIDKEYPATHSMSTAWYAVDIDGNVALMNYEDNGPVPQGCSELNLEDLAFELNHTEINKFPTANFTNEQINEIVEGLKTCDISYTTEFFIVEVRNEYLQEFIDKMTNLGKDEIVVRLSPTSNLFCACYLSGETYELIEHIYEEGGIINSYNVDYWVNDIWDSVGNTIQWKYNFTNTPFYIYAQPYWPEELMERIIMPKNPVKISQMPDRIRRSATYLPVKFCNTNKIQIAEHIAFDMHDSCDARIAGKDYYRLPDQNEKEKYICSTSLPASALINCNECRLCNIPALIYYNDIAHPFEFCNKPTVVIIATMKKRNSLYFYSENRGITYISHSAIIYLTHGYYFNLSDTEADNDIVKNMFKNCRVHFENTISTINPNVIIVQDNAIEILTSIFHISNHNICVNNKNYPCFIENEVKDNLNYINDLSEQPYKGQALERKIINIDKEE